MSITIDNLTHIYKGAVEQVIFHEISLKIASGDTIAVMGPSGVGKTTLIKIIGGLLQPSLGKVFYDDFELISASPKERTIFRRSNIGFVFQDFRLIPRLTVRENILLPMQLAGFVKEEREKRIEELLGSIHMAEFRNVKIPKLSGGQQQRVAIATALANDPAYIIADEPTGNLDSDTSNSIFQLLHDLTKKNGKTLLIATHDLSIKQKVDSILHIENQKITREIQEKEF